LLSRRSPSSRLKVQKRTLLLGWYFMGFAMKEYSEVWEGSCVWGVRGMGK
jgi:heme/copper-type cytochrome/quinol oxidase subunit 3